MRRNVHLTAKATFLTPEQGGFQRPHFSGVRPHLKVTDSLFTSCIVWGSSENQVFEPGLEHQVNLELLSWKEYGHLFYPGMELQLNEGSRIIARGRIETIQGER